MTEDDGGVALAMNCRPHRWAMPLPFDAELRCLDCGRVLDIDTAEPWRLNAIARAGSPSFRAALLAAVRLGRRRAPVPAAGRGGVAGAGKRVSRASE